LPAKIKSPSHEPWYMLPVIQAQSDHVITSKFKQS